VIPCLLLKNDGLVKTIKFDKPKYLGDPINTIRIFNDKEVDELIFLDIESTKKNIEPNFEYISRITTECFMPLTYGGGITSVSQIKQLLSLGIEKVSINSASYDSMSLIEEAVKLFGSSTIIGTVDVKKNIFGKYELYYCSGKVKSETHLEDHIRALELAGVGEILINSIDRDGTYKGYDTKLISIVSNLVRVPIIACGGAGSIEDFSEAIEAGATSVAAGSIFVYHGPHKAVLISYPSMDDLVSVLGDKRVGEFNGKL